MDKTNYLKILSTPIEEIVFAIRLLRDYCTKDNVGRPFDKLEFLELFYLIHEKHANTNAIPVGLIKYLNEYAIDWEEEIIDEIQEEGGYYDVAEDDIWVAKQLIALGDYFLKNVTPNAAYWGLMIVDLFEFFPELNDIEVFDARTMKSLKL